MSPGSEFKGSNVENAVENACRELDIPREKLKYDVISYGSSGIFGLVGTKKARIRVIAPEPETATSINETEAKNQETPETMERTTVDPIAEDAPAVPEAEDDHFPEDPVALGKQVLQRIVDVITTGAEITIEENQERICYKVDGGNPAILIGKRGQTLEAIQYIVEKVINKRYENRIRVQVDIEDYLEMRRDNLKQLAERLAEKAKRTGKPVTIGQMNAHDRRIVHLTLKDDFGVRTKSVGDGYLRKLVIFPKKNVSQGGGSH
jgi:spoIIIJ-associated protein